MGPIYAKSSSIFLNIAPHSYQILIPTSYQKHERWFLFSFMWLVQAIGYLALNYITQFSPFVNPRTIQLALDRQIPFLSIFLIPYLAMYFVESLPYFLIKEVVYLRKITRAYIAVMVITFAVFALFPIKMLRPEIIPKTFLDQGVLFIYTIDFPYNTFPSLHASLTFLAGLVIWHVHKAQGAIILLLAGLISISTLFIKQHYVMDVAGGMVLAVIVYLIFSRNIFSRNKLSKTSFPHSKSI